VRPLVTALLRLAPETELTLFFVPDDYATGREPDVARRMFPRAHVVAPADYVRFALGGRLADAPDSADLVLYLGGDLLHAARVHGRLGGRARSYKFARKRWVKTFERVYAVDAKNRRELEALGFDGERVELVGNLAVDGALGEAAGAFGPSTPGPAVAPGSILVMPGSRRHEIASGVPFFLHMAVFLRERRPDLPVAFALSPFTNDAEIARALATGGHPNVWGVRGTVVPMSEGIGLLPEGADVPFPVVRDAMRYAPQARLVVTLPGTKCGARSARRADDRLRALERAGGRGHQWAVAVPRSRAVRRYVLEARYGGRRRLPLSADRAAEHGCRRDPDARTPRHPNAGRRSNERRGLRG